MNGLSRDAFRGLGPLDRLWIQICLAIDYLLRQGVAEVVLFQHRMRIRAPRRAVAARDLEARFQKTLAVRFGRIHLEALCLLHADRAARLDLFAEQLGISLSEAWEVAEVCFGLGLIEKERFLVKEPHPWLWLNGAGHLAAGFPMRRTGPPRVGMLARLEALAQIRIAFSEEGQPSSVFWRTRKGMRSIARRLAARFAHYSGYEISPKPKTSVLARSGLKWLSQSECHGAKRRFCELLDALLEGEDEEVAILAAGPYGLERLTRHLRGLAPCFDAVVCFHSPAERTKLERIKERHGLSNVHFKELGEDGRPQFPVPRE
jgi:hypothetical protein